MYRPGVGLVLPGGTPTELRPWRPQQFRIKEYPDVVVAFTVENGKVTAMRQRDPSGEYVFARVE